MNDLHPDTFPADCLGLKDAFYQYLRVRLPTLDVNTSGNIGSHSVDGYIITPEEFKDDVDKTKAFYDADDRYKVLIGNIEIEFRNSLQSGEIVALTGTAETPARIISSSEWCSGQSNWNQGFWSNYCKGPLSTTYPGPDTSMGQEKRRAPIFFKASQFRIWLKSRLLQIGPDNNLAGNMQTRGSQSPTDDDARELIRAAIELNGLMSQKCGAKIVRERYPQFLQKRAMALTKELTGFDRPGPKGPRKKVPLIAPEC